MKTVNKASYGGGFCAPGGMSDRADDALQYYRKKNIR